MNSPVIHTAGQQNNLFLMPPFEPNVLLTLSRPTTLNQCIEGDGGQHRRHIGS